MASHTNTQTYTSLYDQDLYVCTCNWTLLRVKTLVNFVVLPLLYLQKIFPRICVPLKGEVHTQFSHTFSQNITFSMIRESFHPRKFPARRVCNVCDVVCAPLSGPSP